MPFARSNPKPQLRPIIELQPTPSEYRRGPPRAISKRQVDHTSTLAQNVTVSPARCGPSQNCRLPACMFPLAGTTGSNSTGPPS